MRVVNLKKNNIFALQILALTGYYCSNPSSFLKQLFRVIIFFWGGGGWVAGVKIAAKIQLS